MERRVTRSKSLRSSINPYLDKNDEESTTVNTQTSNSNESVKELVDNKTTNETKMANTSNGLNKQIKNEPAADETNNENENKLTNRRTRSTRLSLINNNKATKQQNESSTQMSSICENEAVNDSNIPVKTDSVPVPVPTPLPVLAPAPAPAPAPTTITTHTIPTTTITNSNSNPVSIIKTRSHNRLNSTNSLLNSSFNNESTSIHETRKRHLSQTDILNDSFNNEDSNSNSSSIISSTTASNALATIVNNNNNSNANINENNMNSKKQKLLSNQQQLSKIITSPTKINENEVVINKNCIVNTCNSDGHLSGKSTKHRLIETCPFYYGLSNNLSDLELRRKQLDKNLSDINRKLALNINNINSINEKKLSRNSLSTQKYLTNEQTDYLKKVEKLRISDINSYLNDSLNNKNNIDDNELLNDSLILNGTLTNVTGSLETKTINPPKINDLNVPKFDLELFRDALMINADDLLDDYNNQELFQKQNKKFIQFGDYEIETWYKSPYPDDYWQLNKIFICEFCLKYMKTKGILSRHLQKCIWKHPSGKEIYRKDNISFFEVDGKFNKIYCQNLCLLAKLFLDHKTLYFDVEPFLFYVLTSYDQFKGKFNIIGYFSKEKHSILNFNLSCILVLPPYMNKGYGKLLIDFSYSLSKIEDKIGSPERPLSDLGLVSYRSYWKAKLLGYLNNYLKNEEICIKDMSHDTGIHPNDIISTFQYIGLIKYWKGKHVLLKDKELINKYLQKQNSMKDKNLYIDDTCIKWTPYVDPTIPAHPAPHTTHHHHI